MNFESAGVPSWAARLGGEQRYWHPVLRADALSAKPIAVRLLGLNVVLWRTQTGQAAAWLDRCPHRGVKLSMGQVVDRGGESMLQCAYHGWTFDALGRCTQVPAAPEWQPPAQHCAVVFECAEAWGLVWVRLVQSDSAIPWADELLDTPAQWVSALAGPYLVETSAPRLVENFLDMAHFGFVHPGTLGSANISKLAPYEVLEHASGIEVPQCSAWQPNPFSTDSVECGESGRMVNYSYRVSGPYSVMLEKWDSQRHETHEGLKVFMFNSPVDAEQTQTWFFIAARNLAQTPEQLKAFQALIFAQDRPVVEAQSPKALPLSGELHGPLDRVSSAYRRLLKRLDIKTGVMA